MNMSLKSSTNRKRIRFFHIWTLFNLFWLGLGCLWLWLAEKFLQKWRWLFFFVGATRLSCKKMRTVTAKQHKCRFLVLKTNIQNVVAGFALFTVVETSRFFLVGMLTYFSFLHVGQYTSPIVSRILLYTRNSVFLYLVDWNGTLSNSCLLGTKFIFF